MRSKYTIWLLLLLSPSWTVLAQDRSNPRSVGMGRTLVAWSRGTEAIGINPANLAAPATYAFSLTLPSAGGRIGTDLFSYDVYEKYFTGVPGTDPNGKREPKYLTDADKQDLLSSIPDGISTTRVGIEMVEYSMAITTERLGSIGFAMIEHAGIRADLSKDYARFYLYGLDSTTSAYNFDGTDAAAWWWREYNFSYALRVPFEGWLVKDLYVGVSLKLLRGYGSFQTDQYSAAISNERAGMNQYLLSARFDYSAHRSGLDLFQKDNNDVYMPFPDPAGRGTGFDIGASAQLLNGLFVAVSLSNIGSITWDRNVLKTEGHFNMKMDDPFSQANSDSLERAIHGVNEAGGPFSTPLPTVLRLGASVVTQDVALLSFLPGNMLLAVDYQQGLNSSMGNSTTPRLAFGAEYRPISFLPLRSGLSMGGGDGVHWSAGFGLDFRYVCIDVATESLGMFLTPRSTQTLSASAGVTLRF